MSSALFHTSTPRPSAPQVVGAKYVRLYSPKCGDAMRPYREGLTTNASTIDLDTDAGPGRNYPSAPGFSGVPFLDCVMQPVRDARYV
eukprot:201720-Chlamydomonas_euryale.AAC.3